MNSFMSSQEILAAINNLPFDERVALIEQLTLSLHQEQLPASDTGDAQAESNVMSEPSRTPVTDRLFGAFKTDAPPPTDEEIREDYTNYLMEKYS